MHPHPITLGPRWTLASSCRRIVKLAWMITFRKQSLNLVPITGMHSWTFGARPHLQHQHPLGRVATLDINSISRQVVALQRLKCASESIWNGTHLSVSDIYKNFQGLSLSTNQNSYLLFYWQTDYLHLIKQFVDVYLWWAVEYRWKPPLIAICI